MKTITPVVLAIITSNEKYLLTRRRDKKSQFDGKWQLPGGGVLFGESLESALHREIKEELSADIEIIKLVPKIFHRVRDNRWHGLFICFECRLKTEKTAIVLNKEASEVGWYTGEEVAKLDTLPLLHEIISLV